MLWKKGTEQGLDLEKTTFSPNQKFFFFLNHFFLTLDGVTQLVECRLMH